MVERAIVLASSRVLEEEDIEFSKTMPTRTVQETLNLDALEQDAIIKAIDRSNGNLSQAAGLLGISRYALYRKIEKFGL